MFLLAGSEVWSDRHAQCTQVFNRESTTEVHSVHESSVADKVLNLFERTGQVNAQKDTCSEIKSSNAGLKRLFLCIPVLFRLSALPVLVIIMKYLQSVNL